MRLDFFYRFFIFFAFVDTVHAVLKNVTVEFYPGQFRQFYNLSSIEDQFSESEGKELDETHVSYLNSTHLERLETCVYNTGENFTRQDSVQIQAEQDYIYAWCDTFLAVFDNWTEIPGQKWSLGSIMEAGGSLQNVVVDITVNRWITENFKEGIPNINETGYVFPTEVGTVYETSTGEIDVDYYNDYTDNLDADLTRYQQLIYTRTADANGTLLAQSIFPGGAWSAFFFSSRIIRIGTVSEIGCVQLSITFLVDVPTPAPTQVPTPAPTPVPPPTMVPTPRPRTSATSTDPPKGRTVSGNALAAIIAILGSLCMLALGVVIGIFLMNRRIPTRQGTSVSMQEFGTGSSQEPQTDYGALSLRAPGSEARKRVEEDDSSYSELILGARAPYQVADVALKSRMYDTAPSVPVYDAVAPDPVNVSEYESASEPLGAPLYPAAREYEAVQTPIGGERMYDSIMRIPSDEYDSVESPLGGTPRVTTD